MPESHTPNHEEVGLQIDRQKQQDQPYRPQNEDKQPKSVLKVTLIFCAIVFGVIAITMVFLYCGHDELTKPLFYTFTIATLLYLSALYVAFILYRMAKKTNNPIAFYGFRQEVKVAILCDLVAMSITFPYIILIIINILIFLYSLAGYITWIGVGFIFVLIQFILYWIFGRYRIDNFFIQALSAFFRALFPAEWPGFLEISKPSIHSIVQNFHLTFTNHINSVVLSIVLITIAAFNNYSFLFLKPLPFHDFGESFVPKDNENNEYYEDYGDYDSYNNETDTLPDEVKYHYYYDEKNDTVIKVYDTPESNNLDSQDYYFYDYP